MKLHFMFPPACILSARTVSLFGFDERFKYVIVREQNPQKLKKCLNMRGQAGNGIFSKFRFPKVILRQNKFLLPGAFRRIQDGG